LAARNGVVGPGRCLRIIDILRHGRIHQLSKAFRLID